ncbi:hypothetical protein SSE37_21360 [Sagittula stellata E-37]|uniref:Uncharacterized protein n=1 Tax=Sagittula stellata (strain ATCC 700073 / DSM 11524 / E-37) TaxID=388399 RepID=A3K5K0_SAGS3|nr:hypothetical protein SSE37_21360 [Sagittula stellata E-37]
MARRRELCDGGYDGAALDLAGARRPSPFVRKGAFLGKSGFGLKVPFPVVLQAIASISALPGAGKRFTMTMRIRISGV